VDVDPTEDGVEDAAPLVDRNARVGEGCAQAAVSGVEHLRERLKVADQTVPILLGVSQLNQGAGVAT
jgi:hypothetical protein